MSFSLVVILVLIAIGVVLLVMWLVARSKLQPYALDSAKYKKLYKDEKALFDSFSKARTNEVKALHKTHDDLVVKMQDDYVSELKRVQDIHNEQMKIIVVDSVQKQEKIEALEKALQTQLDISKPDGSDKEDGDEVPDYKLSDDAVDSILSNGKP